MTIVTTLDQQDFVNEFDKYNRSENFSIEAREALFDYYDDFSEKTGEDFEMDVISICCDWSELSLENARNEHSHLFDQDELADCEDDEEKMDYIESVLSDETFVIRLSETLLIQSF